MKIWNKKFLFCLCILVVAFVFWGCSGKKNIPEVDNEAVLEVKDVNHEWYYFTDTNYEKTDKPQNAPKVVKKAWTEAVRISSAGAGEDFGQITKAYAVVNRLGMLCFEDEEIVLCSDDYLFKDRTAGNLGFWNNTPIFSVYKSSFFNDTILNSGYKVDGSQHFFLVQFDENAKISYPIVNSNDLVSEVNSEVTDFAWNGSEWICSVKSDFGSKTEFTYVKWKNLVPLLAITPSNARDNISVEVISAEDFRKSKEFMDYTFAPERIQKMLASFAKDTSFILDVKSSGGNSVRKYYNKSLESEQDLYARAILSQSWSCVLFEDGTLFIEGALPGKHILRSGKAVAIRLPKLPAGFVYSDFVITGTTLYAAWEESSFYETARSGFIKVNLDKTLYNRLL